MSGEDLRTRLELVALADVAADTWRAGVLWRVKPWPWPWALAATLTDADGGPAS